MSMALLVRIGLILLVVVVSRFIHQPDTTFSEESAVLMRTTASSEVVSAMNATNREDFAGHSHAASDRMKPCSDTG